MAFSIRPQFIYDKVINWFPGHMAKGLRVISERLSNVDLIVETRDARISFLLKKKKKYF
jgi:ribosome biogenesis GTPase A